MCQDKHYEGMALCIIFIAGSQGQDCDKSWR